MIHGALFFTTESLMLLSVQGSLKFNVEMTDSKILLGKLLQKFEDKGFAKYKTYNRFVRVKEDTASLTILRENGSKWKVDFKRILVGVEFYQSDPEEYHKGPSALRRAGLAHITSPVFTLLHLLPIDAYQSKK